MTSSICSINLDCGNGYIVRCYKDGDANQLQKVGNDVRIIKYLRRAFPNPYTLKDAIWWINHNKENYEKFDKINSQAKKCHKNEMMIENIHLGIAVVEKDKSISNIIGGIGLTRNPFEPHICEIGYWLTPSYWGKKIMSNVVNAMVEFCWNCESNYVLSGIVRIKAAVSIDNIASQKVLLKNNFAKEGTLSKAHCFRDGTLGDVVLLAKIRPDLIENDNKQNVTTRNCQSQSVKSSALVMVSIIDNLINLIDVTLK